MKANAFGVLNGATVSVSETGAITRKNKSDICLSQLADNLVINALKLMKTMLAPFYVTGIADGDAVVMNDALLFAPFTCGPNKIILRNTKKL